ncbi:hypothetical protein [Streptomyces sp. NPDC006463]
MSAQRTGNPHSAGPDRRKWLVFGGLALGVIVVAYLLLAETAPRW